jgi:hypothetical protein
MEGVPERIATIRRWLAVALDRDVTRSDAGPLVGTTGATWGRWENGELPVSRDFVLAIAKVAQDAGLLWATAAWIDYAEGAGPPVFAKRPPMRDAKKAPRLPDKSNVSDGRNDRKGKAS